ncbi:hypothetical protein H6P81_005901 [Aristolochia fimbriata]|uniref:Uncharacterized protein n=1 Tax=Aristolochia fimbriata TaxID=158543 RepID=A0AAV7EZB5_ARIFI|nr:hypothetical protein H6P81_005901 [Aristolochia fimbriata]
MRCKRHPYEGGVGVCALCLRERLLELVAAQEREASHSPEGRRRSDTHHKPQQQQQQQQPPPPLVFPRSVSPYVSRRSGRGEVWHEDHHHHHHEHRTRFYGTPQVGPPCRGGDNKKGRFSLISSIFRSRSDDREADPRLSDASSKSSSPSWISNLLPGRRKKKSRLFSLDEESSSTGGGGCRRSCRTTTNRGMSPVSKGRDEGSESPPGSGYSSESPIGYRKHTPPGPPRRRAAPPHVSGFAFCLSPLVRASPNTSRVDAGFSGEIRSANRFHLSTAASLGANRSRKLADFGRRRCGWVACRSPMAEGVTADRESPIRKVKTEQGFVHHSSSPNEVRFPPGSLSEDAGS